MTRLNKRFVIVAALIIIISLQSAAMIPINAQTGSKIVYVAIDVDTETLTSDYLGSTNPHPTLDVSEYSRSVALDRSSCFQQQFSQL